MHHYEITDETRHYVDSILHTFSFPNKANDIQGAIAKVVESENGDISAKNIIRLQLLVKGFLSKYEFGHDEDYVYIIDKNGNDLKESGSLSAFEENR